MWIVSPPLFLIWGNFRSNVVKGIRKKLSFDPPNMAPFFSRTPMMTNSSPLKLTTFSSGSSRGKRMFRTSSPMTATLAVWRKSLSVMKRPYPTKWLLAIE